MEQSVTKTIARNSFFNTGAFFIQFLVVLVITPYVINKLGTTLFSMWVLIAVITSYAQLSDFGVGRTVIKFISELDGKRDFNGMNEVINTAMVTYILLGSITGIILLLSRTFFIKSIFNIPQELYDLAVFVYVGTVLIFVMNLIFNVLNSFLNGIQRMDLTSSISSLSRIVSAIGVFIVLELGYGLKGLVVKNGIVSILTILTNLFFVRRVLPSIRLNPLLFRKKRLKEILSFSSNVQVSYVVRLLLDPLNKILLSNFLSLNYVAFYEIGMRIINLTVAFHRRLVVSIFPAGSQLYAREGRDKVVNLYFKSMRYFAVIAVPVFSILILIANPFIQIWLGGEYKTSSYTLQILAIPWLVSTLAVPSYLLIQSIGYPSLSMLTMIIHGVTNLTLAYLLITSFGYYGLIVGNSIAVAMSGFASILFFHWKVELSLLETLKAIFNRAFLVNCIITTITLFLILYIKPESFLTLAFITVVFFTLYFTVVLKSGWIKADDIQTLENILPARVNGYIASSVFLRNLFSL